jgi:hypothetical protein
MFAAAVLAIGLTAAAGAQMGGGQMGGHQHGAMQGSMSSDQMMRGIDSMMNSVTSMMRDFTSMPAGSFGSRHDQMMSSMRGLLDQMHQVHGVMGDMAKNPGMMNNKDAMKAFHQAGTEFQTMGKALEGMVKNLNQAAKGMPHGAK